MQHASFSTLDQTHNFFETSESLFEGDFEFYGKAETSEPLLKETFFDDFDEETNIPFEMWSLDSAEPFEVSSSSESLDTNFQDPKSNTPQNEMTIQFPEQTTLEQSISEFPMGYPFVLNTPNLTPEISTITESPNSCLISMTTTNSIITSPLLSQNSQNRDPTLISLPDHSTLYATASYLQIIPSMLPAVQLQIQPACQGPTVPFLFIHGISDDLGSYGPIRRIDSIHSIYDPSTSPRALSAPYQSRSRKVRPKVVISKGALQCRGKNKKKNERCRNAALMEYIGPRPLYCAEHIEQDQSCLYQKCKSMYQKDLNDGKGCKEVVLKEFGFCHKHFQDKLFSMFGEEGLKSCHFYFDRVTQLLFFLFNFVAKLENDAAMAKKQDADLYQRKHKLIPKFQLIKQQLKRRMSSLETATVEGSANIKITNNEAILYPSLDLKVIDLPATSLFALDSSVSLNVDQIQIP